MAQTTTSQRLSFEAQQEALQSAVESIDCERFLSSRDAEYIGKGCTRTVFAVSNDLVVKIAGGFLSSSDCHATEYGKGANEDETQRWVRYGRQSGGLLAPIVSFAHDYSWLVMRRYSPLPIPIYLASLFSAEEFEWLEAIGVEDLNTSNIALDEDGRAVVIDYAS